MIKKELKSKLGIKHERYLGSYGEGLGYKIVVQAITKIDAREKIKKYISKKMPGYIACKIIHTPNKVI